LASTEGLAVDLIDALQKQTAESVKALAETHSLIEVDAARLAAVLEANRETLVRQNMVEKGKSQEQAEGEWDFIMSMFRYLGRAKLDVSNPAGQPRASLEVDFNLPE
jgi:acyl-CoA reductase-like NAD-dependent aldehyde dehydrogenase